MCVCVCVDKEVFCYNQIYFGSIVLCLQYIYIYIYIERERERERDTYKKLYISSSVFLFALYFQASTIHKMLKIKLLIQAIFILF